MMMRPGWRIHLVSRTPPLLDSSFRWKDEFVSRTVDKGGYSRTNHSSRPGPAHQRIENRQCKLAEVSGMFIFVPRP